MRKYLFNPDYNFYKANMHCHTVLSDGKRTPEEIKADYMQKGYQIVAYTDHRVVIPHNDLAEENFLPITASVFVTVSLWLKNPTLTKIISVPVSAAFLIYDIFVGSYIGIVNESLAICSIIISFIKSKLERKEDYV